MSASPCVVNTNNRHFSSLFTSNIDLGFSLNHLPCLDFSTPIEFIGKVNDKYLAVISEDKFLSLYSVKYGLYELVKIDLKKQFKWSEKKLFESIAKDEFDKNQYFTM